MSRYIDAELLEPDTEWDEREDGFISYSQLNIDTAETADVRGNVKGEWRFIEGDIVGMYDCSNCGHLSFHNSNYCPNCGAQMMRGEA